MFYSEGIDYWSIMNCSSASSKLKEDDFSEITEKLMGKKARVILYFLIIIYSYTCVIMFYVLIFALFGRFIRSIRFSNYGTYNDFLENKWDKPYIKYPFLIGIAFLLLLLSLKKNMNKINVSAYIGVRAVI